MNLLLDIDINALYHRLNREEHMIILHKKNHLVISRTDKGLFQLEAFSKNGTIKKIVGSYSYIHEIYSRINI